MAKARAMNSEGSPVKVKLAALGTCAWRKTDPEHHKWVKLSSVSGKSYFSQKGQQVPPKRENPVLRMTMKLTRLISS